MLGDKSFKILLTLSVTILSLVYWVTWHDWSATRKVCCKEPSEECRECKKAEEIFDEYCANNPDHFGCPPPTATRRCCDEESKDCLACKKGVSTEELCKRHPGSYGCQEPVAQCCKSITKECIACRSNMNISEFCQENAGQYGCPGKNRGDIMLAISLFNEIGYIQFTSSVLRQYHKVPEKDIFLFYNASLQSTEKNVREWYGEGVHLFPIDENKGHSVPIRLMFDYFIASSYKILFITGGQTVILQHWKEFIESHIYNETDGFLSLYHSSVNHNYSIDCEKQVGNLCQGQISGQMGVAITHSLAATIAKKYPLLLNELNWTKILRHENIRSFYPVKSLTMQIGQKNQGSDNCGENEVAYRFNRCAFPEWIKNGIEFYFDRCTSANEMYFPEHSMEDIEKEGRFWTRPVVSYSLYGSKNRYTQIACENAARVFSIYPGWKIWMYVDRSIPKNITDKLCEYDVRFIDMSLSKIKSRMSWRFLVASELVKMYAIRDVDSYLLKRGKAAVDEWIKSGRKFHVLRDHPNHSRYPMSGGMWGGTHDAIPNMKQLLEDRQMKDSYMQDMNFLNEVIWNIARKSVWAHDSHSIHRFGEDHPFPTKLEGKDKFIGNVVLYKPK